MPEVTGPGRAAGGPLISVILAVRGVGEYLPGSFLATASMDHFSIFASYERVFAALDDGAAAGPAVRAAVFGRMVEHYSSILANGLVPRRERRRFFAAMAADFRRYRPPGYRRPPGPRGLKTALICHDAYHAYALLAPVNKARMVARRALPGGG